MAGGSDLQQAFHRAFIEPFAFHTWGSRRSRWHWVELARVARVRLTAGCGGMGPSAEYGPAARSKSGRAGSVSDRRSLLRSLTLPARRALSIPREKRSVVPPRSSRRRHLPAAYPATGAGRVERRAVRCEGHAVHLARVAAEDVVLLTSGRVPQPHRPVRRYPNPRIRHGTRLRSRPSSVLARGPVVPQHGGDAAPSATPRAGEPVHGPLRPPFRQTAARATGPRATPHAALRRGRRRRPPPAGAALPRAPRRHPGALSRLAEGAFGGTRRPGGGAALR